ncbi:MAG: OsmC family protein [Gemmatimonadetes bacterium]|nr:OsmC family protein [Gemmatimonadota bacterium]
MKAEVTVALRWTGEGLQFEGGAPAGPAARVDGRGMAGSSPMQTLLLALAGCTGSDVVEILGKMRVPLTGLEVRVEGERAAEPPRRYTRLRLVYQTRGVAANDEAKVRRAIALSHEKYCSVLHSLRPELDWSSELVLA